MVLENFSPFTGTQLYFTCWFDDHNEQRFAPVNISNTNPQQQRLTIATNLVATELHKVYCGRSSEAAHGETSIVRIEGDVGVQALVPDGPRDNELRFEAIGDSISAGHKIYVPAGVHQAATTQNEDVFRTYVRRLADAWATSEWRTVARSGASVTQTSHPEKTMLEHWGCRQYSFFGVPCQGQWSPQEWQADVVTINLGTNDYLLGNPEEAAFKMAYRELISQVRFAYPGALIMCIAPLVATCPNTFGDNLGQMVSGIRNAVSETNDDKVLFYSTGAVHDPWLSCNDHYSDFIHPTPEGNTVLADRLLATMTNDIRRFFPSKCGGSGNRCDGTASTPRMASNAPTMAPTDAPTVEMIWQEFATDKYCLGSQRFSHQGGSVSEGNWASQAACQSHCESNAACMFYLWRHDPLANQPFTCATFRGCPTQVDYSDGDGGHVWRRPDAPTSPPTDAPPTHPPTNSPTNLPTNILTNHPTDTPTNPVPTVPPTNPPTNGPTEEEVEFSDDWDSELHAAATRLESPGKNLVCRDTNGVDLGMFKDAQLHYALGTVPSPDVFPLVIVQMGAGWQVFASDQYCVGGAPKLSHEASAAGVSTLTSGNAATQAACQAACESNAECKFYLWRHDPNANAQFTCARFRACPTLVSFGDGDGGHVWRKIDGPTPPPTNSPSNSPTSAPTTSAPTTPSPTHPPTKAPTNAPTPPTPPTNAPSSVVDVSGFKVHFIGRWWRGDDDIMRTSWGMGGFVLRFTGTTRIAVVLKGTRDFIGRDFLYYVCKIDGRSPREDGDVGGDGIGVWRDGRATPGGSGTLTIATDLVATEEYTVRCGRSSEASYADTLFMGIEADPGERSSMSFIVEISFKGFKYDTLIRS